jgi:hypothetical protein
MLEHLDAWDRSAERRHGDRRRTSSTAVHDRDRRVGERRAPAEDTLERRRESDLDVTPDKPSAPADMASPPQDPSESAASPAPRGTGGRNEAPLVIVSRTS